MLGKYGRRFFIYFKKDNKSKVEKGFIKGSSVNVAVSRCIERWEDKINEESVFVIRKTKFKQERGYSPGGVILVKLGNDNWQKLTKDAMSQDMDTSTERMEMWNSVYKIQNY